MIDKLITGEILNVEYQLSLLELARVCAVDHSYIVQLVEFGILAPEQTTSSLWRFNDKALKRTKISIRLQRDLDVNLQGIAVILDLLEQRKRR